MASAAPAPVATIADGDVVARATPGVRNRSRNDDIAPTGLQIGAPEPRAPDHGCGGSPHEAQKLLTTAAKTSLIVVASVAWYDVALDASAMRRSSDGLVALP